MELEVDNLKLSKSLGKGAFGEVFLTQIEGKEGYYATKRLDRVYSEKKQNIKRLFIELTILNEIKHPNIVNYIESKKTKNHIYIVMEYCNGGSLSKCLKKYKQVFKKPFTEKIVQYLMRQILNALNVLHSNNILHRDLKLDNILVCFNSEKDKESLNMLNSTVKITDFGFCSILNNNEELAKTVIGTPIYMPPDMINAIADKKNIVDKYAYKSDIWSLGILCYEMLVGNFPFDGENINEINDKMKKGIYPLPLSLSQEAVFFIQSMLQENPEKRLSCNELLKQDFINKDLFLFQIMNPNIISGIVTQQNGFLYITILNNKQVGKKQVEQKNQYNKINNNNNKNNKNPIINQQQQINNQNNQKINMQQPKQNKLIHKNNLLYSAMPILPTGSGNK